MKRTVMLFGLILAMLASVTAGTMAVYTTSIGNFASGSVVAKNFVFLEDGEDTFRQEVKIAPTETVVWKFAVKNYDGGRISETGLTYDLTFDVHATPGKSAVDPLVVTIKDKNGTVVNSVTGVGVIHVSGAFPLSAAGQSDLYTVEINWPSDNSKDYGFAGSSFGTTINVSGRATQDTAAAYTYLIGSWQYENGVLGPVGSGEHRALLNGSEGTDYEVLANATYSSGDGYGIYYRAAPGSNGAITGYCFQFDPGLQNKFVVREVLNGHETNPVASVSMSSVLGSSFNITVPHSIKISIIGSTHVISVDGVTVLSFTNSRFSEGSVGFRSWSNTVAHLNSISVVQR